MDILDLQEILINVTYKDGWSFLLSEKGDSFLLQVVFNSINVVTGEKEEQKCRKWFISRHSCKNEVVNTALKAILAAEEHEARENFKYKGQRIFDPHVDYDKVADFMKTNPLNTRDLYDPSNNKS
jgi:hypothetical protein